MTKSLTYADAGVDIDKANRLVDKIKDIARRTPRQGVMGEIGGFGGLFSLNVDGYEKPVLVSSTDGVGTKLKIAFMTKHPRHHRDRSRGHVRQRYRRSGCQAAVFP